VIKHLFRIHKSLDYSIPRREREREEEEERREKRETERGETQR
jgi:hypothetical protein